MSNSIPGCYVHHKRDKNKAGDQQEGVQKYLEKKQNIDLLLKLFCWELRLNTKQHKINTI